jgi:uncharacterized protein
MILRLELGLLYIVLPLSFYLRIIPLEFMFIVLLAASVYALIILLQDDKFHRRILWQLPDINYLLMVGLRFLYAAIGLIILTYIFYPEWLFSFPLNRPYLWLLVMIFYPILSVYPQELLTRTFFFHRYAACFSNVHLMIWTNAWLFAFMHLVFAHWLVLGLSFIGGLLFAYTYHYSRSLMLVSIEHALYGNLLFTLGIGRLFYHGNLT